MDYTNDLNGQVIDRTVDPDAAATTDAPREIWYRYGGQEMGYTGNNGTENVGAADAIDIRTLQGNGGIFANGQSSGSDYADFDQNYQSLNSFNQGSASGTYTVRGGETLQSIAAGLYGDSSLWYKIASANGLSGDSPLIEGTSLRLPAGVTRNTYNANTFKPYDPAAAIGETSPTAPQPPKAADEGCGTMGLVLTVVVAIAVFAITKDIVSSLKIVEAGLAAGGTTAALTTSAVAATSAAAASAASQGTAIATGIQDKFSFKQVARAALTAGATAGASGTGGSFNVKQAISDAARYATGNAIRQGIRVVTGQQNSFNWGKVAAAAIDGSGLGEAGSPLSAIPGATQVVSAAERSLRSGTSFGDEFTKEIPNVVGQALGGPKPGEAPQTQQEADVAAAVRVVELNNRIETSPTQKTERHSRFNGRNLLPPTIRNADFTLSSGSRQFLMRHMAALRAGIAVDNAVSENREVETVRVNLFGGPHGDEINVSEFGTGRLKGFANFGVDFLNGVKAIGSLLPGGNGLSSIGNVSRLETDGLSEGLGQIEGRIRSEVLTVGVPGSEFANAASKTARVAPLLATNSTTLRNAERVMNDTPNFSVGPKADTVFGNVARINRVVVNGLEQSDIVRIREIGNRFKTSPDSNIAFAEGRIDGINLNDILGVNPNRVFAISGKNTNPGLKAGPVNSRRFNTVSARPGQQPRLFDSEVHILERLAGNLSPSAHGRLTLISERTVCPSCESVIDQFSQAFPNIDIFVRHGGQEGVR